jgi:hypothetical protein
MEVRKQSSPILTCPTLRTINQSKTNPTRQLPLTEHYSMKAYWGSILHLGTRWWVDSFTPRPLYPQGKSPWYPLDRRLRGPQRRSGRDAKEKNSQPLPRLEPLTIQPVVQRYRTELSRLLIMFGEVYKTWSSSLCSLLSSLLPLPPRRPK